MRIREAAPDETHRVAKFHVAGWRQIYGDIAPPEAVRALGVERRLEGWQARLRAPGTWVAEAARRQGLGERLLRLGWDRLSEAGVEGMGLWRWCGRTRRRWASTGRWVGGTRVPSRIRGHCGGRRTWRWSGTTGRRAGPDGETGRPFGG